jgi:hypothetical protein
MKRLISAIFVSLWLALPASNVMAQSAADVDGVKAASKEFYAALAVLDNGEAMEKVWAHTPYVTYVGPRHKSVLVGWDAFLRREMSRCRTSTFTSTATSRGRWVRKPANTNAARRPGNQRDLSIETIHCRSPIRGPGREPLTCTASCPSAHVER